MKLSKKAFVEWGRTGGAAGSRKKKSASAKARWAKLAKKQTRPPQN